jgi:hypothetical protein
VGDGWKVRAGVELRELKGKECTGLGRQRESEKGLRIEEVRER